MKQTTYTHETIHDVCVGLRPPHYQYILENQPPISWFEVLIDNYMGAGGMPLKHLDAIRAQYPITFHSVGMSLGSTDPLNTAYLQRLKELIQQFEPTLVSDHLCWTGVHGYESNDLLPMPYTEESIKHVVERIQRVQDFLGQQILVENVSSYISYTLDAMTEWEFYIEVVTRADALMLFDVNNIYVSAQNHSFDAMNYLNAIPPERVKEMHLAGYEDKGTHLLDTHGYPVHPPVWELYKQAIERFGKIPTLIEWDNNIPDFPTLLHEAEKASLILQQQGQDYVITE